MMGEDENWRWADDFTDRDRIGDLGVFSVCIGIPQDWYFFQRQGGYNVMFFDFVDEEEYIQEIMDFYTRYALARLRAVVAAKPDEVFLGGSVSSLSASSIELSSASTTCPSSRKRRASAGKAASSRTCTSAAGRGSWWTSWRRRPTWTSWSRWRSRRAATWTSPRSSGATGTGCV